MIGSLRAVATAATPGPRFLCMRLKKARSAPGAVLAVQAASTSILRASRLSRLEMRPCLAGCSPDCQTRGGKPKQLLSLSGDGKRAMSPIEASTVEATT